MSKTKKKCSLVKKWTFEDGMTREKVIYTGTLRGAKRLLPPKNHPRYNRFEIRFGN